MNVYLFIYLVGALLAAAVASRLMPPAEDTAFPVPRGLKVSCVAAAWPGVAVCYTFWRLGIIK